MIELELQKQDKLQHRDEILTSIFSTNPFDTNNDFIIANGYKFIVEVEKQKEIIPQQHFSPSKDKVLIQTLKEIEKYPQNPNIINSLGILYLSRNELILAEEQFKKAIEIKKNYMVAYLNLGLTYILNNQSEKAIHAYDKFLTIDPDNILILENKANLILNLKKFTEAKKLLQPLLLRDKDNISILSKLALIEIIDKKYDSAIKYLRKAISVNINVPALYNNLGIAYRLTGSIDKAISTFKIAIKFSPTYSKAVYNLSKSLFDSKKKEEAISVLEVFISTQYDYKIADLLSYYYYDNKKYNQCQNIIQTIIKNDSFQFLNPIEKGRTYNNYAVIWEYKGDIERSEKYFVQCLEQDESIANYTSVIEFYFRSNNIRKLNNCIDSFAIKHPNDKEINLFKIYSLIKTNKIDEALIYANKYIEYPSPKVNVYYLLSYMYSTYKNEYIITINMLNNIISNYPNDVTLKNNLIYSYLMRDDIVHAEVFLKELEGNDDMFLTATRGLYEIKKGDIQKGRELYNLASRQANYQHLKDEIIQKKNLEIAKYYILINNIDEAMKLLNDITSKKSRDSVYKQEALQVINKTLYP